jgi:hypothetical protein
LNPMYCPSVALTELCRLSSAMTKLF